MSLTELAKRARALFNFERTFVCAVLLIVSWQLFFPPVLGLADNGDYARLMVHFDLTHAATDWGERYFGFIDRHYLVNAVEARKYSIPGFISSEMIFVGVASGVGRALGSTSFDLLYLGAVHVLALAASVFLLLLCTRAFVSRTRTIALILGTVVFTDIAYIAYFNSFYSESATLLFFVMTAACAYGVMSTDRQRIAWLLAYFASASAFLLAKYQNIVLLPVFLLFGGLLVKRWGEIRHFYAYLFFAVVASYVGYLHFISSPDAIDEAVLYNSVFNGILMDSPTASDDLAALGLDRGLARYAGSTAFQPDSPRFNPEFLRRFRETVTIGTLFRFYLVRPGRLLSALDRAVKFAFQTRPTLGNYEKASGRPPRSLSRSWAMWSTVRSGALPRNLWFTVAIAILYLGWLSRRWLHAKDGLTRLNLEWSALIPVMALAQLVVITVSDGISDLIKHAYLFNLLVDYMLVALFASLLAWLFNTPKNQPAGEEAG